MCLPQHQIEFLYPQPVQIAEPAVAVACQIAFTFPVRAQLRRQVLVGREFLVDIAATTALRRRSNPMPITVPNYSDYVLAHMWVSRRDSTPIKTAESARCDLIAFCKLNQEMA